MGLLEFLGIGLVAASGWMFAAVRGWRTGAELRREIRHNADVRGQLKDRSVELAEEQRKAARLSETEKRLRRNLEATRKDRDDAYDLIRELRPTGGAGAVFDRLLQRAQDRDQEAD